MRMRRSIAIGASAIFAAMLAHAAAADTSRPSEAADRAHCDAPKPKALTPLRFVFPRDNGAHDGFATELWRTFGRLTDTSGANFDITVTISRDAIDPCGESANASAWNASHLVTSAIEIYDETTGRTARDTRVDREGTLGARIARDRFALATEGLRFAEVPATEGPSEQFTLSLAGMDEASATLAQRAERPAVALGPHGVTRTGSCTACSAYGYAYTRNTTRGSLAIDGIAHIVSGRMWLEHEFARRELDGSDAGWDRFDITFDDGRELDARFTRGVSGGNVAISGAVIDSDGRAAYLDSSNASESNFPPNTTWQSVASGTRYPSAWLVNGLEIGEVSQDHELFTPGRTPFYSGPIDTQSQSDGSGRGYGFVELTGYGGPAIF